MIRVLLLLLLLSHQCVAFETKPTLKFIAGEWPKFTNADGTGTYWEIIKAVFQDHFELDLKTTTWNRAYNLMDAKQADAIVGLFSLEKGALIIPRLHIDTEYAIVALYDEHKNKIQSAKDLSKLTIAGRSNYGFEHFIPEDIYYYGVESINNTNKLIFNDRVDAVLVSVYNLKKADPTGTLASTQVIPAQKLYIGFQNNELGRELIALFDKGMQQLITQKKLEVLFPSSAEFHHANFGNNQ